MSVILDASEYKYFPQLFTSLQSMQQFKFQCHTKCLISFSLITLISDLLKILYTALIQLISFLKHMFNQKNIIGTAGAVKPEMARHYRNDVADVGSSCPVVVCLCQHTTSTSYNVVSRHEAGFIGSLTCVNRKLQTNAILLHVLVFFTIISPEFVMRHNLGAGALRVGLRWVSHFPVAPSISRQHVTATI